MDLSSHRNNVHEEKQEYKCNHCEEVFSNRSNLKRHIEGLEESNSPDNSNFGSNKRVMHIVYNCSECNEEYIDKRSLKHDTTSIAAHIVQFREYENRFYTTKLKYINYLR